MRRSLVIASFLALLVSCAPAGPGSSPSLDDPWVAEMLDRVNVERAGAGLGPLQFCGTLSAAAQGHSQDQAAMETMSHTGSNGSGMGGRADAAGYVAWTALAENVATGYETVDAVTAGWMTSNAHRANLLSASYEHLGVGRAVAASGTVYWTQDFGRSGSC